MVWSKGDEPVRIGSKVLCNYEGREDFEGKLEPVGVVVYSHTGFGKWWVRFEGEGCVNTAVLAHPKELKEIGLIDDLQEVKGLAISWGANPFDSCWEGKPYV